MERKIAPATWLAAFLLLALVVVLREVLLTAFFGLVLAVVWSFPVDYLGRKMSRGLATGLTLLGVLLAGGGLAYAMGAPLVEEAKQLQEKLPEAVKRARSWVHEKQEDMQAPAKAPEETPPKSPDKGKGEAAPKPEGLLGSAAEAVKGALEGLFSGLTAMVLVFVLSFFFVHEPTLYKKGLRSLVPKAQDAHFDELWKRLAMGLRNWVGAILISMLLMGAFTAIALMVAGIQNWMLLGLITFFGTFIPYVGAIGSAVPGMIMALAQSNGKLLAAAAVYLGVHLVEGYIVQPLIMKRAAELPPAGLLLFQLAMGTLGGALGIVVATPLYVCVKITVGYLYVEEGLGKKADPV